MSDPITIAAPSDLADLLILARGRQGRAAIAAAAGCDARTLRRHESGETCNLRTLIDLIGACGYQVEARLMPTVTAGATRVLASPTRALTTYDRALDYVGSHPGTGSRDVAAHLRIHLEYARKLLRRGAHAGQVRAVDGEHRNAPIRYWRAEHPPE